MSSVTTGAETAATTMKQGGISAPDWDPHLIRRQIVGILGLETRKSLFGARALVMYFLAFAPVIILLFWNLHPESQERVTSLADAGAMFAGIYSKYLRTSIFLSTLILFMSLFRAEILQRSLHYYLLTPVRREVLVVGKYLAALLASSIVFSLATVSLYLLIFAPLGAGELSRHLFQGTGFGHLFAYAGISILACAGYGAVFLLMGLLLRNPVIAGVFIWGWESVNFILPALLKKASVILYLQALYPVPLPEKLLSVVGDPISAWMAVPGLMGFIAVLVGLACWRARTLEISYGGD